MSKYLFIFWTLIVLFPSHIKADTPSLRLFVDQEEIGFNESLTLTVLIQGGSALTAPELSLKDFEILGRSQSNSIEIINGQMSMTKSFEYTLSPKKTGLIQIGPVTTHIEGKKLTAGPLQVRVSQGSGPPPQILPPSGFGRTPSPNFPSTRFPQWAPKVPSAPSPQDSPQKEATFLKASLNKKEAYVGEEVLYTVRLYSAVSVNRATYKLPPFGEFISEPLVEERRFETQIQGQKYLVVEWKVALYPLKSGEIQTGQSKVSAQVPIRTAVQGFFNDPFFSKVPSPLSWQAKEWSSENLKLKVKELPKAPENFTGLVGNFSLKSQLSPKKLKVGESAELLLTLEGKGNLATAKIPSWETPGFKIYPSTPQLEVQKTPQGLEGKKTFQYALVAQKEGKRTLSLPKLFYFNPKNSQYETLQAGPWALKIGEGSGPETLNTAGLESESPLPPPEEIFDKIEEDVLKKSPFWAKENLTPWLLILLSPSLYLGFQMSRLLKHRASLGEQDKRRSQAFKNFKTQLKKLKAQDTQGLSLNIKNYFGDRLKINAQAMTAKELSELLSQKGLGEEKLKDLEKELQSLEYAQYAPEGSQEDWNSRMERILPLIRGIEKEIKN